MIKLKSLLLERTLYHGTVVDNVKDIKRYGLIPSVGNFVKDMYDEYPEEELKDLIFATDKEQLGKAVTAITHHISRKLNKDFHSVTDQEFINYGVIIKIDDGELYMTLRNKDDHDREEHPYAVEPGDYYSEDSIGVDEILTGTPMIRLLRRYGEWPRIYGPQETINKKQELIKMALQYHPDKPREVIIQFINNLSPSKIEKFYYNYKMGSNKRNDSHL